VLSDAFTSMRRIEFIRGRVILLEGCPHDCCDCKGPTLQYTGTGRDRLEIDLKSTGIW
jgi:hypothetical protein